MKIWVTVGLFFLGVCSLHAQAQTISLQCGSVQHPLMVSGCSLPQIYQHLTNTTPFTAPGYEPVSLAEAQSQHFYIKTLFSNDPLAPPSMDYPVQLGSLDSLTMITLFQSSPTAHDSWMGELQFSINDADLQSIQESTNDPTFDLLYLYNASLPDQGVGIHVSSWDPLVYWISFIR